MRQSRRRRGGAWSDTKKRWKTRFENAKAAVSRKANAFANKVSSTTRRVFSFVKNIPTKVRGLFSAIDLKVIELSVKNSIAKGKSKAEATVAAIKALAVGSPAQREFRARAQEDVAPGALVYIERDRKFGVVKKKKSEDEFTVNVEGRETDIERSNLRVEEIHRPTGSDNGKIYTNDGKFVNLLGLDRDGSCMINMDNRLHHVNCNELILIPKHEEPKHEEPESSPYAKGAMLATAVGLAVAAGYHQWGPRSMV